MAREVEREICGAMDPLRQSPTGLIAWSAYNAAGSEAMKSLLSFGIVLLIVGSSFPSYGGTGPKPTATIGPVDVLSDTMGVDFAPYVQRVLHDVRLNWYNNIPESAKAPIMKKGKLTIQFAILKNGKIARMKSVVRSGDFAFDHGAWAGITASNPFLPLPSAFPGEYLELRMTFCYNPD